MREHGVPFGLVAGEAVEVCQRNRPLSRGSEGADQRVERNQRHGQIGRMRRDARRRGAEDRQVAVVALRRWAARPALALVAGPGDVLEVDAAGALQQIAPDCGDIAWLAGGAREQGLCQNGVACPDRRIGSEVGVADQRADAHAPVRQRVDLVRVSRLPRA